MICRGCGCSIPSDPTYLARVHYIEGVPFHTESCFKQSAPRLYRELVRVSRHITVNHNSKASHLLRMCLLSDKPVPLL